MSTTTHPMTGLRRVILDAIIGVAPTVPQQRRLAIAGPMLNRGDNISERYVWSDDALNALPTDDLMALYDTLRPGILESMGKGE